MTEPARDATTPEALAAEWAATKPPAAGPLANLAAAAIVVAIGIAGMVLSFDLGAGSLREPAPGTWPLAVSTTLTVLGLALAARAGVTHDAETFTRRSARILVALATMLPFSFVIGDIGFEIPGLVLTFIWLRFLGRETWRVSIVGSILIVAGFYAIFVAALGTSIPHLF